MNKAESLAASKILKQEAKSPKRNSKAIFALLLILSGSIVYLLDAVADIRAEQVKRGPIISNLLKKQ